MRYEENPSEKVVFESKLAFTGILMKGGREPPNPDFLKTLESRNREGSRKATVQRFLRTFFSYNSSLWSPEGVGGLTIEAAVCCDPGPGLESTEADWSR